jgi:3',5'-cyclic AMP phosphodiesterase CpdA
MFRKRLGDGATFRSFDYGRWHFILLDPIGRTDEGAMRGYIDDEQLNWLSDDLAKTGKERPVCVALHIPLVSAFSQIHIDTLAAPAKFAIVNNGTRVIKELLSKYNVKLVLQGHLHVVEEIKYKNMTYIIGGSLSSARKDPNFEHPEGFVVVDVSGDEFRWKYETYGFTLSHRER